MRKIFALCLLVNVGGCASYESRFDCNAPSGSGCRSVSEINEMVNRKELGTEQRIEATKPDENHLSGISYSENNADIAANTRVIRLPERTMRIWVDGFSDDKGDYVGETRVYTVLEPGKWYEGQ